MDIDDLFQEVENQYRDPIPDSGVERIILSAEREFREGEEMIRARAERLQEKKSLQQQIKQLTFGLRKYRNVKNHRLRKINASRRAKRQSIKQEIEMYRLKLREIEIEE